jgi:hypothetical protein
VAFTYDVPFVGGIALSGAALNGLVNVTARFTSIVLPAGATLIAGSGTTYPAAAQPTVLLNNLSAMVASLNLTSGISNSLDAKLQNALQALNAARAGDVISACNRLQAFTNEVAAQSGSRLTEGQAGQLSLLAGDIMTALACR